jgi:hypothetical protein
MEYRRAYHDEKPDTWLVARHEREISPLLHRRALFAEVQNFLLYDFFTDSGQVDENVFAYSNRLGDQKALVIFNNRYGDTSGWVRISSAYAVKTGDGGRNIRQRSLADSFGVHSDGALFMAARDAVSGLEYLHSARDLADKGLHFHLHAYQCHVFLDWREMRDDATHPWNALCHELAGRGVSSLDDALRGLQLKPLHDAMRKVLASALLTLLVETEPAPGKKKAKKAETAPADASKIVSQWRVPLRTLLERSRQLSVTDHERVASATSSAWSGDIEKAIAGFEQRVTLAMKLPGLEKSFEKPWPEEAHRVLSSTSGGKHQSSVLAAIVAWSAMVAIGDYADPTDAECSASRILDQQRLREPIAHSLEPFGVEGDERWRAAARIRALLAHKPWAPGDDTKNARAPFSWLQDPDMAWLIGVHSYEGVRYFDKEPYEQLLWWMALPALLRIAAAPKLDPAALELLEEQIEARTKAAADASYEVDGLFAPPTPAKQKRLP